MSDNIFYSTSDNRAIWRKSSNFVAEINNSISANEIK